MYVENKIFVVYAKVTEVSQRKRKNYSPDRSEFVHPWNVRTEALWAWEPTQRAQGLKAHGLCRAWAM